MAVIKIGIDELWDSEWGGENWKSSEGRAMERGRRESLRACCRTLRTDTSSERRADGENPKIRSRKQS